MKEIPLTQGKVAIVDDADYEWLNQWKWCLWSRRGCSGQYAIRKTKRPNRHTIYMHCAIMGDDSRKHIDHIDRNGLNNARANLRFCTPSQNRMNSGISKTNSSGYLGVCSSGGRFAARIKAEGRGFYLGAFVSPIEAAWTYDEAARKHHGEFCTTNGITKEQVDIERAMQSERRAAIKEADNELRNNVRRELVRRGLKLQDFAYQFGLSRGSAYHVLSGHRPPRGKYRAAMLNFLGDESL